jgi:hypothetical protein
MFNLSHDDKSLISELLEVLVLTREDSYGQGNRACLVCPLCSGSSLECGLDPFIFNEDKALASFRHEDDCKLHSTRTLLSSFLNPE